MSIKFVDFDWAGKIGDAEYPLNMNPTIDWHEDVTVNGPIMVEHDRHLLDSEFKVNGSNHQ